MQDCLWSRYISPVFIHSSDVEGVFAFIRPLLGAIGVFEAITRFSSMYAKACLPLLFLSFLAVLSD